MNASGRFVQNVAWLTGGEIVSRIIAFIVAVYLARVLGTAGYGLIGTAFAFVSYFGTIVSAGFDFHAVRDTAQQPEQLPTTVANVLGSRLILMAVAVGLMACIIALAPRELLGKIELVHIYALTLLTLALNLNWALRALEQMHVIAVGIVAQHLVMAALMFTTVHHATQDLWRVPAIQVLTELALITGYIAYLRTRFPLTKPNFSGVRLAPMLKETMFISLGRIPRMFYYQGDVLLLFVLASASRSGEFLAAHKIILSVVMIGIIYQMNVLPVTSRLAKEGPAAALTFQLIVTRYAFLMLIPLVVLFSLFATPLIVLIYGKDFSASGPILFWMILTVPFFVISIGYQDLLVAFRKTTWFITGNIFAMLVHLTLGVLLIPNNGGVGAAMACLVGELAGTLCLGAFVWKAAKRIPLTLGLFSPVLAGICMLSSMFAVSGTGLAIELSVGLITFLATAVLTGAVRREEYVLARDWLYRKTFFRRKEKTE